MNLVWKKVEHRGQTDSPKVSAYCHRKKYYELSKTRKAWI